MSDCKEIRPGCVQPEGCPDLSFCLPFGARVETVGGCLVYTPGSVPPDGVYDQFTVENGCIVDAHKALIPVQATPTCAPVPCNCDESGAGSLPAPSTNNGNLFQYDAAGRPFASLTVTSGPNLSVTGTGTATDPLNISVDLPEGSKPILSGNAAITVETTDTATVITHKDGHGDTINGMTFDAQGHLTAYTEPPEKAKGVTAILGDQYITVTPLGGDTTSGIQQLAWKNPNSVKTESVRAGGNMLSFVDGFFIGSTQTVEMGAGTYKLGDWHVSIDSYGTIVGMLYEPEQYRQNNIFLITGQGALTAYQKNPYPYSSWVTNRPTHDIEFTSEMAGNVLIEVQSEEYNPTASMAHGISATNGELIVKFDGIEYNKKFVNNKVAFFNYSATQGNATTNAQIRYTLAISNVEAGTHTLELPLLYTSYGSYDITTQDWLKITIAPGL